MRKKTEKRIKGRLKLRTMGISNWVYDKEKKEKYSIQFYDYDYKNGANITPKELRKVIEIFPYDCIMYGTKHGIHFISFSLLHGLNYTKAKALKTSKELGCQDYWSEQKDLTLRISPKWKKNIRGRYIIKSEKPQFRGIIKNPSTHIISNRHLEFFHNFMNLPDWAYYRYKDCDKRDYKIKIYHYKTRD